MSWTEELVSSYIQSEWANRRRVLNEPQAREELLSGAKLYCHEANSTMPTPIYNDAARTTCFPNPLVLNSSGRVENAVFPALPFRLSLYGRDGIIIAIADNCGADFVA